MKSAEAKRDLDRATAKLDLALSGNDEEEIKRQFLVCSKLRKEWLYALRDEVLNTPLAAFSQTQH